MGLKNNLSRKAAEIKQKTADLTTLSKDAKFSARTSNRFSKINAAEKTDELKEEIAQAALMGDYSYEKEGLSFLSAKEMIKNLLPKGYVFILYDFGNQCSLNILWYGKKAANTYNSGKKFSKLEDFGRTFMNPFIIKIPKGAKYVIFTAGTKKNARYPINRSTNQIDWDEDECKKIYTAAGSAFNKLP